MVVVPGVPVDVGSTSDVETGPEDPGTSVVPAVLVVPTVLVVPVVLVVVPAVPDASPPSPHPATAANATNTAPIFP